ncbi:uncharacterized protein UTRI_02605_B [Ustilago trichophora]|uniref:Uncharacterized protein n=1 Tax=Ustilago trichophora TaxID=86804 RepID=A0A5C3E3I9_9BASI|nr:uncharacterized protein UTRI_02605_B [Ustilago trichophora]
MRYQTSSHTFRPSSQLFQSNLLLLYIALVLASVALAGLSKPPADEPGLMLTLEKELMAEHARHQAQQVGWALKIRSKPIPWATNEHSLKGLFQKLGRAHGTTEPDILAKINEFRKPGFRYEMEVDPGLHAPLGTRWNFQLLGPYPSVRLAQAGFKNDRRLVETELDNALDALNKQNWMETYANKFELAYTDDINLLRSAIEYHQRRLTDPLQVKAVQGSLKKMKIGPAIKEIVRPA